MAPLSVAPSAWKAIEARKSPVGCFYLDLGILAKYWGPQRVYHHTAPISMVYALREGLRLAQEEGLEARFARHLANAEQLWAGLEGLGLALHVPAERRLPVLTTVSRARGRE